jgi:hypothetical protein
VFGWSDENCARPSIFMCEIEQKSPPPPSPFPQKEGEKYFVGQGTLNTSLATRNYWLGYQVISNWPRFEPVAPSATGYTHWGTYQPGFRKEPNQVSAPELCACESCPVAQPAQSARWGAARGIREMYHYCGARKKCCGVRERSGVRWLKLAARGPVSQRRKRM